MAIATFALTVLLVTGSEPAVAFAQGKSEPTGKAPAKTEQKEVSMSGCVDQQEGRYVLLNAQNLSRIADLEAVGFPTEGFAKHLGHTVTVRGIENTGGTTPLMKVRTVVTLSETCAPQNNQRK